MLKNALFFINILKIAVSGAKRSVITQGSSDFSTCYIFVLKLHFTTQQFCW